VFLTSLLLPNRRRQRPTSYPLLVEAVFLTGGGSDRRNVHVGRNPLLIEAVFLTG